MGLKDDHVMQLHLVYMVCQLWVWIACVVVFGAELMQSTPKGGSGTVHFYYGRFTVSGSSSSNSYRDCDATVCDKCYSGGAGILSMAVFCWLGVNVVVLLRALFLGQKRDVLPVLGTNDSYYAWTERLTNYWNFLTLFLGCIAWGAGCITEAAKTQDIKPTAYVFVVMALAVQIACIVLIHMIHRATDFGSGNANANPSASPKTMPAPGSAGSAVAVNGNTTTAPARSSQPPLPALPQNAPAPQPQSQPQQQYPQQPSAPVTVSGDANANANASEGYVVVEVGAPGNAGGVGAPAPSRSPRAAPQAAM